VGSKAEDQVLEAAKPAGDAAGVFSGGGAPAEVGGPPGGGQRPVAGKQVLQDRRVQRGPPGGEGVRGSVAGLDQQACQLGCPGLLRGLEVMQALEIY